MKKSVEITFLLLLSVFLVGGTLNLNWPYSATLLAQVESTEVNAVSGVRILVRINTETEYAGIVGVETIFDGPGAEYVSVGQGVLEVDEDGTVIREGNQIYTDYGGVVLIDDLSTTTVQRWRAKWTAPLDEDGILIPTTFVPDDLKDLFGISFVVHQPTVEPVSFRLQNFKMHPYWNPTRDINVWPVTAPDFLTIHPATTSAILRIELQELL